MVRNKDYKIIKEVELGRFFMLYTKHPASFYTTIIQGILALLVTLLISLIGIIMIYKAFFTFEISYHDGIIWLVGLMVYFIFLLWLFKKRKLLITDKGLIADKGMVLWRHLITWNQLDGFYIDNGHLVFIGQFKNIFRNKLLRYLVYINLLPLGLLWQFYGLPITFYLGEKKCQEVYALLITYLPDLKYKN